MKQLILIFAVATIFLSMPLVELYGSDANAHVYIGLSHFYRNRYLEAYKEFRTAIEKDPRHPEAQYNLGRVYKAQGFVKEALIQFQNAVKLRPNYLAAQREIESIRKSLESDIAAQKKIQGLETIQRTQFDSMPAAEAERRARELLSQGRKDEALTYFELALRESPNNVALNKMIGFLRYNQNHFSESLEAYMRAQTGAPTDSEIIYAIGLIYMKTQAPDRAEKYFNQAVKLQPTMIKAIFALGEAYEAQDKFDEAIFQFKRCLEISPNLKEAKDKLSYLAGRQGFNYFTRGSYYYQRGEYDKVEALLSMARQFGNMTMDQNRQIDEMINASRYWVDKQKEQNEKLAERRETSQTSYINRNISVYDVSNNPNPYLGQAVEWSGDLEFFTTRKGKDIFFVNSRTSVNSDFNMDYSFEIILPKNLSVKRRNRVIKNSTIMVKGKILKVEKLYNEISKSYSSGRQPVIEASEVEVRHENFDQPIILRFY